MPDLDELLTSGLAGRAGDSARVPSWEALSDRGARRRRVRRAGALVCSSAVVVAIAVGGHQLTLPSATAPIPAPQPTQGTSAPPSARVAAAQRIIGDATARIQSLTVAPGSPDHRLAEWYVCLDPGSCRIRRYALAVTGDGFATTAVVDLPSEPGATQYDGYAVEPAGPEHFIVSAGTAVRIVVGLDGHIQPITVRGRAAPATRGEIVSTASGRRPLVVDPATAVAHPLSMPAGDTYVQGQPGRLWAAGGHLGHSWSDDGGAHWTRVTLSSQVPRSGLRVIPTSDSAVYGFVAGGFQAGSTLPWLSTVRGAGTGPLTAYPAAASSLDPAATAILPDGRLLVLVTGWPSWESGRHTPRAGFYVSRDWSRFTPVPMGAPFDRLDYSAVPAVLGVTAEPGTVTVYAATPGSGGVVASTDAGATWHDVAAR